MSVDTFPAAVHNDESMNNKKIVYNLHYVFMRFSVMNMGWFNARKSLKYGQNEIIIAIYLHFRGSTQSCVTSFRKRHSDCWKTHTHTQGTLLFKLYCADTNIKQALRNIFNPSLSLLTIILQNYKTANKSKLMYGKAVIISLQFILKDVNSN